MTTKKYDLPAMPFYIGDWKKDPGIQALSREERMIWFELIMYMWESEERGYLVFNGKPVATDLLCNMLGICYNEVVALLEKFDSLGLYSKDNRGAIFSRKIVNILELSAKRAKSGKLGGNKRWQTDSKVIASAIASSETENEIETETDTSSLVVSKRKEQILEYCKEQDYPISEGESFYDYYQALGWQTNAGMGIADWKAKMRTWHREQATRGKSNYAKSTGRPETQKDFKQSDDVQRMTKILLEKKNGKS